MLGAIIGDIAGSKYEWINIKSKDFEFMDKECSVTDDSIMSLAVARALVEYRNEGGDLSDRAIAAISPIIAPNIKASPENFMLLRFNDFFLNSKYIKISLLII